MGIRFYCPNGHKLNVKSDLAGKIGICPKCRARMTIPTASVRESSRKSERSSDEGLGSVFANAQDRKNERFDAEGGQFAQNQAFATGETASDEEPLNQFLAKSDRVGAVLEDVLRRAVDDSAQGGRGVERLDDANEPLRDPSLVWYVRSRDNQQYGPATGDVMRSWINERRVGPQTLVWREDWASWQEAGRVFPELERVFAGVAAAENDEGEKAPSAFASLAEAAQDSGAARRFAADEEERALRRRKRATKTFAAIAGLIALILGLLGALIFVLLRN